MATKITKAQNFNAIRKILVDADKPELVAFVDHELELLANKAAKRSSTPTKAQKAGAKLKEAVYTLLVDKGEQMTIAEIDAALNWAEKLTPQKISAQLTNLIEDGQVERNIDHRVRYYKAV